MAKLMARQIGERMGRATRAVQLWFAQGCPHEVVRSGRIETRVADLDEVTRWVAERGLDTMKPGKAARAAPARAKGAGVDGENGEPAAPDLFGPIVKEKVDELVRAELARFGSDSLALMVIRARRNLEQLLANPPQTAEAFGEWDRYSGAIKSLSGELRQLEDSIHKIEVRNGRWVLVETACRLMRQAGEMYAADLVQLQGESADAAVHAVEPLLLPGRAEEARRLVAISQRDAFDRARARRAEQMRMLAEEAEQSGRKAAEEAA